MKLDNRISLQKLEVLRLVVELGGVHRAAERLFVAQPVVSAHLRSLQERVGAQLFVKDGRRLRLTEAGERVYQWATDVLGRREALAREIADLEDGTAGTAVVAASMSVGNYFLPPPIIRFTRAHPRARVTLLVSDPEAALRRTEAGECDFCDVLLTDMPIDGEVFVSEPLGRDELVVIAAADSDLPEVIAPQQLAGLPAVCPPPGLAIRRLQEAALRGIGVLHRPVSIELGSAEAMKQAVAAGIGIALLSRTAVRDELESGTLQEIRVDAPPMTQQLQMVRRASKRLSPLQAALADEIRATIGTITPPSFDIHPDIDARPSSA